jgi:hypothetical protein
VTPTTGNQKFDNARMVASTLLSASSEPGTLLLANTPQGRDNENSTVHSSPELEDGNLIDKEEEPNGQDNAESFLGNIDVDGLA